MPTLGTYGAPTVKVLGNVTRDVQRRDRGSGTFYGGKWAIDLEIEDLHLAKDEYAIAAPVAEAVVKELKDRILGGKLGMSPAATVKRRAYRDAQFARSDDEKATWQIVRRLEGRKSDEGKRAHRQIRRITFFRKRFITATLGAFSPETYDNAAVGRESGILGRSCTYGRGADGKGIRLYFAANRSRSKAGGSSAVERVFGRRPDLMREIFATGSVQEAARKTLGALVAKRALDIVLNLGRLASAVNEMAETAGEAGEVG